MDMSRRMLIGSATALCTSIGGSLAPRGRAIALSRATPGDAEPLTPEAIFERLLESDIVTPLFPADTGEIMIAEWIDDSDRDLDGAIGGVLFQTGEDENGNVIGPGQIIVHPSVAAAEERGAMPPDEDMASEIDVLGFSGFTILVEGDGGALDNPAEDNGYALTVIRAGVCLISGLGEGASTAENGPRSVVNAMALVDQLLRASRPPGGGG